MAKRQKKLSGKWVFASVGVLLLMGGLLFKLYEIRQDEKRFLRAEASLETLYADIEKHAGKPDEVKRDKSCSYASRKFGKGPLSCRTAISFAYKVNNNIEVNTLASGIEDIISSHENTFRLIYSEGADKTFSALKDEYDFQEKSNSYKQPNTDIPCYMGFTYASSESPNLRLRIPHAKEVADIELVCGGPSKAEHFPISN